MSPRNCYRYGGRAFGHFLFSALLLSHPIKATSEVVQGVSSGDNSSLGQITNAANAGALGQNAAATKESAFAIGTLAAATGNHSLAIGKQSSSQANGSISLGTQAATNKAYAIAIGSNAVANGTN